MKYIDGRPIRVGDQVWWNDGTAIGYIYKILASAMEYAEYGFDEPSLLIRTTNPLPAHSEPQFFSVAYSKVEDLGVWLTSDVEKIAFQKVIELARERICNGSWCYSAFLRDANTNGSYWEIRFFEDDKEVRLCKIACFT